MHTQTYCLSLTLDTNMHTRSYNHNEKDIGNEKEPGHYVEIGIAYVCFALCCSVLQCVAVRCSVLQCVAVCCSVLQCVAVYGSVLQCVAVCCSMLQCVTVQVR